MCYFNKSSKTSESAGCAKAPKIVKISIFRRLPIQADLILWGKILAIFCVIPDQKAHSRGFTEYRHQFLPYGLYVNDWLNFDPTTAKLSCNNIKRIKLI